MSHVWHSAEPFPSNPPTLTTRLGYRPIMTRGRREADDGSLSVGTEWGVCHAMKAPKLLVLFAAGCISLASAGTAAAIPDELICDDPVENGYDSSYLLFCRDDFGGDYSHVYRCVDDVCEEMFA